MDHSCCCCFMMALLFMCSEKAKFMCQCTVYRARPGHGERTVVCFFFGNNCFPFGKRPYGGATNIMKWIFYCHFYTNISAERKSQREIMAPEYAIDYTCCKLKIMRNYMPLKNPQHECFLIMCNKN